MSMGFINLFNKGEITMARVRNNQGFRKKALDLHIRPYLEQENTQEREGYLQAREVIKPLQTHTFNNVMTPICRRHYTESDVAKAYYLQNKFENVDTIAKDSCFHVGYYPQKDVEDKNQDDDDNKDAYITKHFDFRLDGNINGNESSRSNDFGYAYFRDELKSKVNKGEKCNPDINIEQKWGNGSGEENQSNPHWTSCKHANERELGLYGGDDNKTLYAREWNDEYSLDLIGREYCRDRSIDCKKEEFDQLMIWQVAKSKLIQCHTKWIETILEQCKLLKSVLRDHIYLEQTIELCNKMGITINETDILATTSKGIVVSNADVLNHLETLKNKTQTREQKILARKLYDQQVAN
jgi:hypothetical protein